MILFYGIVVFITGDLDVCPGRYIYLIRNDSGSRIAHGRDDQSIGVASSPCRTSGQGAALSRSRAGNGTLKPKEKARDPSASRLVLSPVARAAGWGGGGPGDQCTLTGASSW